MITFFYPNIFGMFQVERFCTTALSQDKIYFCFLFSVLIGFRCVKKESDHHRIFWHYCWSCYALHQFEHSASQPGKKHANSDLSLLLNFLQHILESLAMCVLHNGNVVGSCFLILLPTDMWETCQVNVLKTYTELLF